MGMKSVDEGSVGEGNGQSGSEGQSPNGRRTACRRT